jgi:hypothetical protein
MTTNVNSVSFSIVAKTHGHDVWLTSHIHCCQPSKTLALQKLNFCLAKITHCASNIPFPYEMNGSPAWVF